MIVALSFLYLPANAKTGQETKEEAKTGEEMVELMPAFKVPKSEAEFVEKNQQVLLSNQHLIEKVLTHLGVSYYEPKLPKYRAIGANSILSVIDQCFYAAAAKKLGAPMPESFNEQSGTSIDNNLFLHLYNNEILRSIAKKLDLKTPDKVKKSGSNAAYGHQIIVQNHEILTTVANKLGVKP